MTTPSSKSKDEILLDAFLYAMGDSEWNAEEFEALLETDPILAEQVSEMVALRRNIQSLPSSVFEDSQPPCVRPVARRAKEAWVQPIWAVLAASVCIALLVLSNQSAEPSRTKVALITVANAWTDLQQMDATEESRLRPIGFQDEEESTFDTNDVPHWMIFAATASPSETDNVQ